MSPASSPHPEKAGAFSCSGKEMNSAKNLNEFEGVSFPRPASRCKYNLFNTLAVALVRSLVVNAAKPRQAMPHRVCVIIIECCLSNYI